ncbi:uncharacterized protein LOC125678294 isoform X4 [Ostrea edulis]|uniref:uncharacterized protein LOC125678294 isoform X4 n=1 Tax=Ostrea edulis TaxID=37623 RepID=UPI0024AFA8D2|nr:uncharacterized protein LOC125678294 isoform X4 [Ostrea edulis]
MTISIIHRDMTPEENTECSHEFNFFLDRQLQTKLLEQDEILHAEELYSQFNINSSELKIVNSKVLGKNEEIQGWVSEPKVVLRKPERESVKQPQPSWRDFRNKQVPIQDPFVFKHYGDIRAYIEQYRRDHTNGLGFKSHSALERMQGDGIRRYGHSPSQIHVQQQNACNCGAPPCASEVQKYLTAALQYTNRQPTSLTNHSNPPSQGAQSANPHQSSHQPHTHNGHICTKHNHHQHADKNSQAYKYKLSPDCQVMWSSRTESQNSERVEQPSPRMQSAKVYPSGKVPTKVSVPAVPPNGHVKRPPVSVAWRLPSRVGIQDTDKQYINLLQNNPNKIVESVTPPSTNIRTLDTLACVATDKQIKTHHCETPKSDRIELDIGASVSEDEEVDNSDSDAISMSRLSTACLGADLRVKSENLEPSCTYHVFPNEMMLDTNVTVLNTRSLTWYPSISTPPRPKSRAKHSKADAHPSHSMPEISVAVAEYYSPRLIRSRTEDKIDFPLIKKDVKGMLVAADINIGDQAKLGSNRTGSGLTDELETDIETPRIMSLRESKTKLMKNLRKKYAGYINNKGKKPVHKPTGVPESHSAKSVNSDRTGSIHSAIKEERNVHTADPTLHYWRFDQKENDRKSVTSQRSSRQREADEESMIKVAEYLLSDSNILATQGRQQEQSSGHKRDVSMAEGMWFDASGRAYVSLAARYDPLRK